MAVSFIMEKFVSCLQESRESGNINWMAASYKHKPRAGQLGGVQWWHHSSWQHPQYKTLPIWKYNATWVTGLFHILLNKHGDSQLSTAVLTAVAENVDECCSWVQSSACEMFLIFFFMLKKVTLPARRLKNMCENWTKKLIRNHLKYAAYQFCNIT